MNRIQFLAPRRWTRRQRRSEPLPKPPIEPKKETKKETIIVVTKEVPKEAPKEVSPSYSSSDTNTNKNNEGDQDDSKIQAIVALRDLVVKQRAELSSVQSKEKLYKKQLNHLTMTLQDREEQGDASICSVRRKRLVSFGPSFERSDDLAGFTSSGESTREIEQAISSIQKQASQVETAMVLDELQSVKLENERLKQKLESTQSQLRDVREELEECQQEAPTLSLERELAQAEATKCREDLQACLQLMAEYYVSKEEEPNMMQTTGRRLFGSSRSSKPKQSKPAHNDDEIEFSWPNSPKKLKGCNSGKMLCIDCKMQQRNVVEDDTMQTPTQSTPQSTNLVTPSPRDGYVHEQRHKACRTRQCKVAMGELERQLEHLQQTQAQKEAAMVREVYRLERDLQDANQSHLKLLQSKDIQIHRLQKQLSTATQQRGNHHIIHF